MPPEERLSAESPGRLWLVPLTLLVLVRCRQTDAERLNRKVVEGVYCIVVRDGIGKAQAIDCDWSGAHR